MAQVAQRLRQQPGAVGLRSPARRRPPARSRARSAARRSSAPRRDRAARARAPGCPRCGRGRRRTACRGPTARAARRGRRHVERAEELADRIRRPAVVVVERDPAEDVIAGDQQPALGLVEAHVRGRVSRRLVRAKQRRGRSRPSTPSTSARSGSITFAMPDGDPRRVALGVGRERRLRHAALAADLEPAGERGLADRRRSGRGVAVIGVHPQLAPGALDDRRRLAPVVGVGVRADEQPHVLEAEVDLVQRALELGERAGLVRAGVDEHDARIRPRSPTRCRAAPRATEAAAAGATGRAGRARRVRALAAGSPVARYSLDA